MFDPAQLTLGQISSALRDFTIVAVLISVSWKARGYYERVSKFFDRVTQHMTSMETFARTVTNNHLTHIEADLKKMSGRQDDLVLLRDITGGDTTEL